MNELINELADKATTIVEMVGPQGYTSSYANFDRKKFAELVVKECLSYTEEGGLDFMKFMIKKNFGVEA